MKVLVAYATRHGATKGIAERIAETLGRRGLEVTLLPATEIRTLDGFEAFVIGGAAYMGHWLSDATDLVRKHRQALHGRPVWLFSSGPVGKDLVDAKGRDVITASVPEEFAELAHDVAPRDMKVFFGAHDPDAEPANVVERLGSVFLRMPAVREALPSGDFRDWPAIEAWADGIAASLRPVGASSGSGQAEQRG